MLFAGWEVRIEKNCDRSLENAARGPRGGTPYNGLYGEAPPERVTFFSLQVYKRVGISQA